MDYTTVYLGSNVILYLARQTNLQLRQLALWTMQPVYIQVSIVNLCLARQTS